MAESPTVPGHTGAYQRADVEALALNEIGDTFQLIIAGLRVGVGQKEEVIDAIIFLTIHFSGGGEVEHALEADGGS